MHQHLPLGPTIQKKKEMLEAKYHNAIGKSCLIQRSKYIAQEDTGQVQSNGRKRLFKNK